MSDTFTVINGHVCVPLCSGLILSYSTEYGGAPYMVFVFSHCHYTPVFMPLNNIAFHMVLETDQTSDSSVLALSLNFCSNALGDALVITVTVIRLVLYCGREMTLGSSPILKVLA